MTDELIWERDGLDWPNRAASRFVMAAGLRWHVQQAAPANTSPTDSNALPTALLVHGTGASTHSWAELFPLLTERFQVVAFDLPGHGFTQMPGRHRMSLPAMADAVRRLLDELTFAPRIVVGHSAGAAILVRLCLDGAIAPRTIVSLNGAFVPFGGVGRVLLSPLTRLIARSTVIPELFARRCEDESSVERLLQGTGSNVPARQAALYRRLMMCTAHDAAALAMMASWDLDPLLRDMRRLATPLVLVAGGNDRTISPEQAFRVRDVLPSGHVVYLRGLGHLMHEERPAEIERIIGQCFDGEPAASRR